MDQKTWKASELKKGGWNSINKEINEREKTTTNDLQKENSKKSGLGAAATSAIKSASKAMPATTNRLTKNPINSIMKANSIDKSIKVLSSTLIKSISRGR